MVIQSQGRGSYSGKYQKKIVLILNKFVEYAKEFQKHLSGEEIIAVANLHNDYTQKIKEHDSPKSKYEYIQSEDGKSTLEVVNEIRDKTQGFEESEVRYGISKAVKDLYERTWEDIKIEILQSDKISENILFSDIIEKKMQIPKYIQTIGLDKGITTHDLVKEMDDNVLINKLEYLQNGLYPSKDESKVINWFQMHKFSKHYKSNLPSTDDPFERTEPFELLYNIEWKYSFVDPFELLSQIKKYIHFAIVIDNYLDKKEIMDKTEFDIYFENQLREANELPFDHKYSLERFEDQLKLRVDNIGKNWVMPTSDEESYLVQLNALVRTTTVVTITGKGGMGKTALVIKWISDFLKNRQYNPTNKDYENIIFWTTKLTEFDQEANPKLSQFGTGFQVDWTYRSLLQEIASHEGKTTSRLEDSDLKKIALEILTKKKLLIVLDNFEDLLDKPFKLERELEDTRSELNDNEISTLEEKIQQYRDEVTKIHNFLNELDRQANSNVILTSRIMPTDLMCKSLTISGFTRKQARRLMVRYFQCNKGKYWRHMSPEGKKFFPLAGDGASDDTDKIFTDTVDRLEEVYAKTNRSGSELSENLTYPIIIKHLTDLLIEEFSNPESRGKDVDQIIKDSMEKDGNNHFLQYIEDHYEWASKEAFSEIERDDNHPKCLDILKRIYETPSTKQELQNHFEKTSLEQIEQKIEKIRRHDIFVVLNDTGTYSVAPEAKLFVGKRVGSLHDDQEEKIFSIEVKKNLKNIDELITQLDSDNFDENSISRKLNSLDDIGLRRSREPTLLQNSIFCSRKINLVYEKHPNLATQIDKFDEEIYKLCEKHISQIVKQYRNNEIGITKETNHLQDVLNYLVERHKDKFAKSTEDIWNIVIESIDNDNQFDLITAFSGAQYTSFWKKSHRLLMEKESLDLLETNIFYILLGVQKSLKFMKDRSAVIKSVTKYVEALGNHSIEDNSKKNRILIEKYLPEINLKEQICLDFINQQQTNVISAGDISSSQYIRNKLIVVADAINEGYIISDCNSEDEELSSGLAYIQEFDYTQGHNYLKCIQANFSSTDLHHPSEEDDITNEQRILESKLEEWCFDGLSIGEIIVRCEKFGMTTTPEQIIDQLNSRSNVQKICIFNRKKPLVEWQIGPAELMSGIMPPDDSRWATNSYFYKEHKPDDLKGLEEKLFKISRDIIEINSQDTWQEKPSSTDEFSEYIIDQIKWKIGYSDVTVTPKRLWELQKDKFASWVQRKHNENPKKEVQEALSQAGVSHYDVAMHWMEENYDRSGLQELFHDRNLRPDDYELKQNSSWRNDRDERNVLFEMKRREEKLSKAEKTILISRPKVVNYTKSTTSLSSIIERALKEESMEKKLISIIVNILESKPKIDLTKQFLINKSIKDLDAVYNQTLKETIYQRFFENIHHEWRTSPIEKASDFMLDYLRKNSIPDSVIEPWW